MSRVPNLEMQKNIIKTAYKLYSQKGYDAVTTRQLAEECVISRSLLYHYYNTKAALCSDIFTKIRMMVTEYLNTRLSIHYPDPSFGAYRNGLIIRICLQKGIISAFSNVKENPELLEAVLGITTLYSDEVKERKLNRVELGRMMLCAILQQMLVCKEENLLDISYLEAFNKAQAMYYLYMEYDQVTTQQIMTSAEKFLTESIVLECIDYYEKALEWGD